MSSEPLAVSRIQADSVVGLAYEQIRALILTGDLPPRSRLGQGELAERLGISRTPVREALRRLAGEGLVDFEANRGFRTAELGLDAVLRRLEVRLILEPGIARLAAERRTSEDLERLRGHIAAEDAARSAAAAHDGSRDFHLGLARATGNDEMVKALEALWIVEVGRRLLARRAAKPDWQSADVDEHREILAAVEGRDAPEAERLMAAHIGAALQHWAPADGAP